MKQGHPSKDCAYLDKETGDKCAVGCLLSHYKEHWEGCGISTMVEAWRRQESDADLFFDDLGVVVIDEDDNVSLQVDFLEKLQHAHDESPKDPAGVCYWTLADGGHTEKWNEMVAEKLQDIAADFELDLPDCVHANLPIPEYAQ
jgi:hypothetical protein